MARQKNDGRGRLGGRAKGTPNKVTSDLRAWIKDLLLGDTARFSKYLKALEPNEYVQAYLRLINYIVPKQKPVEYEDENKKKKLTFLERHAYREYDDDGNLISGDDDDDDDDEMSKEEYQAEAKKASDEYYRKREECAKRLDEWYQKEKEKQREKEKANGGAGSFSALEVG